MSKKERKRVKGRQSRKRKGKEEGTEQQSARPASASSGDPDGERWPSPAGRSSPSRQDLIHKLAALLQWLRTRTVAVPAMWVSLRHLIQRLRDLTRWLWDIILWLWRHPGQATVLIIVVSAVGVVSERVVTVWQCRRSVAPIKDATAYANWYSVSAKITEWEQECRGCSRELDVEVNVYKALSEVWAGRISSAKKILATLIDTAAGVSPDLGTRVCYVNTVLDRAEGRMGVARTRLDELLNRKPLPDDVRFDALYDLTILEMSAGNYVQADKRLKQTRKDADDDEMRGRRAELLTGLIKYTGGQRSEAERVLKKISFDSGRAPSREGLRWFLLSLCREQARDFAADTKERNDAKDCFKEARNKWEFLDILAHEVNYRIHEADRKANRTPVPPGLRNDITSASRSIEEARRLFSDLRGSTEEQAKMTQMDPLYWIHLRLKLSEAELEIVKLRVKRPDHEERVQGVRGDVKDVLLDAKGNVHLQVRCHLVLAQLATLAEDHRERAENYFEQARELAHNAGLLYEKARVILKRAEYHRRAGEQNKCEQDLRDAIVIWKKLKNDVAAQKTQEDLYAGRCSYTPP